MFEGLGQIVGYRFQRLLFGISFMMGLAARHAGTEFGNRIEGILHTGLLGYVCNV